MICKICNKPVVSGVVFHRECAADTVQVVRCKACKHWQATDGGFGTCPIWQSKHLRKDDNFCSYGQAREE